jgi:hypothetical protein
VGVIGALEDLVDFAEDVVTTHGFFIRDAKVTGCKREVTQSFSGKKQKN